MYHITWLLFILTLTSFVNAKFDPIAFTAGIAISGQGTYTDVTTVPYSYIITNHMQRNELSDGVFTCTEGGTFVCQVHSISMTNATIFLDILHNDIIVASVYGHGKDGSASGGNAVVLALTAGDNVQVKTRANKKVYLYKPIWQTFTCSQAGSTFLGHNKPSVPAFSVLADRSQKVIGGASIMYNTKLLDTSNAFDSNKGFTAPSAGIYIFHFFGLSMQNEELWHEMFVNGNYICSIRSKMDFEWAAAGNTVILHLLKNDTVSIKARAGTDSFLFGDTDLMFTSFSGVQIITDIDAQSIDAYPVVAFSVGLAKTLYNANVLQSVTFDRVFTNYGHAFNLSSGLFVAPVTGVYEFSYHFRGKNGVQLRLTHNNRLVDGIYSVGPGEHFTAGNAAVLNLIGGDVVTLVGSTSLYGDPSEIYCIFSGYLMHAVSPDEIVVGK